jgi:hypothetical protein
MLPFERPGEIGSLRNPFSAAYAAAEPDVPGALERMASAIEEVYGETLRFRPDLSYAPKP